MGCIGRLTFVSLLCAAYPVSAQSLSSRNYSGIDAVPGKPVKVDIYASADRKNCSSARAPSIRVLEAPREGALAVTPGAVTTDKVAGCPPIKLAAQAVVYTARAGGTGVDKVVYEVTSANGQVVTYQVSITIKEDAPASPHRGKDQKT
jgi:hypothetical protein